VLGIFHVFGCPIVLTPKPDVERLLDAAEPRYDEAAGIAPGASRLSNDAGLIFKMLGMESAPVTEAIPSLWERGRGAVTGTPLPDRFLWCEATS
jgi:urease accessory protein